MPCWRHGAHGRSERRLRLLDRRLDAYAELLQVAGHLCENAVSLAVLIEAFADDWGYHPEPFDEWAHDYANSPNYDPTTWLLARDGAEPVAASVAQVYGDRGWISEMGVLKSHRGRGIAAALLRRSFTTFGERGLGRVMLNVDAENPTGATALYERVDMRIIKRWDLWERSQPDAG